MEESTFVLKSRLNLIFGVYKYAVNKGESSFRFKIYCCILLNTKKNTSYKIIKKLLKCLYIN